MRSIKPRVVIQITACFVALALLCAAPIYGKELQCGTQNVMVDASTTRDAADSCHGAAVAVRFLAAQGLNVPAHIRIRVVEKMPDPGMESAIGAYMRAKQEVFVLTYSALKKSSYSFRTPLDRSLYRAAVSHEVAHAIAASNFKQEPSSLGQEYIAYATLFSTMAPAQREKILRYYPPDDDWQIHAPFLYFIDPLAFGAQAYQHFLQPGNGQHFIRKILDGKALCDPE